MRPSLADIIKGRIAELGYSDLKHCARDYDIPYELLRKVVSEGHLPKEKTLLLYAEKLGIQAGLLLETTYRQRAPVPLQGWHTEGMTSAKPAAVERGLAPVLGYAACGPWLESQAIPPEEYAPVNITDPDAFFVVAEGDSMTGAHIPEKARLLVSPAAAVRNGDIVLAKNHQGEYTVKKLFRKTDGSSILQPLNPAYEPLLIPPNQPLSVFRIIEVRILL